MNKKPLTVDAFVKSKVPSDLRPAVSLIRAMMRRYVPEAQEIINKDLPAYKVHKVFAVISPTKTEVNFSFPRGAEFVDIYGLLEGEGKSKTAKFVKLRSIGQANQTALRYYIKQALKLDAEKAVKKSK